MKAYQHILAAGLLGAATLAQAQVDQVKVWAAACANCHGTNGHGSNGTNGHSPTNGHGGDPNGHGQPGGDDVGVAVLLLGTRLGRPARGRRGGRGRPDLRRRALGGTARWWRG